MAPPASPTYPVIAVGKPNQGGHEQWGSRRLGGALIVAHRSSWIGMVVAASAALTRSIRCCARFTAECRSSVTGTSRKSIKYSFRLRSPSGNHGHPELKSGLEFAAPPVRPLCKCPPCGRRFANRNQVHSSLRLTVRHYLRGRSPLALPLYRRFVQLLGRCGPVIVVPNKTRIGFQVPRAFADVMLKKNWLDACIVLARRLENPQLTNIQSISPRNHIRCFRIHSAMELDGEILSRLREAYCFGQQKLFNR